MTKRKSTKSALISSVLALFLCFAMLLGSTFAWFTDSVTSGSNVIKSGKLSIAVEYTLDGNTWKDLDGAEDLFQKGLWEPGHTEVVALRIKNNGTLALKYGAKMNIINETVGKTVDGEDIVLSEILTVSTLVQQAVDADGSANQVGAITLGLAFKGENNIAYENTSTFKAGNVLRNDVELQPGAAHYMIVKVDMPETVGNEANYGSDIPTIEFGINVLATQSSSENDSFDNNYDANAWTEVAETPVVDAEGAVNVWTAEQLAGVMSNVKGIKTINIMENIDLSGRTWVPANLWDPENTALLTINGNGHTISNMAVASAGRGGFIGSNSRNITINDLTFKNASVTASGNFAGTVIGYAYGNITLNNVDVVDSVISGTDEYSIRIGGLIGFVPQDGGTLTLTNCDVTGSAVSGYHNVGAMVGTTMTAKTVTIESCTATNNTLTYASSNVGAFAFGASTSGYVEYVPASGFTAENNKICKKGTVAVGSYEELKAAVVNGGTIVLAGDLAVDERINIQNGQNVVLDLNGHTLSANGVQPFFVADGSITINNGTCEQTGSARYITVGTSSATTPPSSDVDYAYATFNNVTFVNHTADGDGFGTGNVIHALGKVFVEVNECTFDVSTSAGNALRPMDAYNWGNGVYVISEGTKMTWDYTSQTSDTDYYGFNGYSVYRHIQLEAGCVFKETTDANGQTWYEVVKDTDNYIFVSTAQELANALENANSAGKNIAITADIDMSGVRFTSPTINNHAGNNTGKFIIDGGYHTVSNMQDMLIAYTGSAKLVEIRRLTLDKANIAVDVDDTVGTTGVGAFIGYAGTSEDINIFDCHLTNSTVNGGHWTGGFVGYAAGYSGPDGPVFETLEMKWSSVENSTITGKGSVGGFIGHATGDEWTKVEIHWYSVVGNTITSTGDSTVKAGSIMGTVGCAGQAKTVTSNAGVTKTMTGGVDVNNDRGTSENTVTSNGVANDKVYGRQGSSSGTLKVGGKVVDFE